MQIICTRKYLLNCWVSMSIFTQNVNIMVRKTQIYYFLDWGRFFRTLWKKHQQLLGHATYLLLLIATGTVCFQAVFGTAWCAASAVKGGALAVRQGTIWLVLFIWTWRHWLVAVFTGLQQLQMSTWFIDCCQDLKTISTSITERASG